MVSIIIPTYNRGYIIKKSIDSVLHQTYEDFELIIVDDGSTDGTKQLIDEYEDDRIKYYSYEHNKGVVYARNYGMKMAKGDYIAFQDSDDVWHSDKLEKQLKILEDDYNLDVVYCRLQYVFKDAESIIMPGYDIDEDSMHGNMLKQLLLRNIIPCPCLIMRKECYDSIGEFDSMFKALEDYDYVLRLSQKYKIEFIEDVLVDATPSDDGVSSNYANYIIASCQLLGKYKKEYLETDTFNSKLQKIITVAEEMNVKDQVVGILELLLK